MTSAGAPLSELLFCEGLPAAEALRRLGARPSALASMLAREIEGAAGVAGRSGPLHAGAHELALYLAGCPELPHARRREIARHLGACETCGAAKGRVRAFLLDLNDDARDPHA